MSNSAVARLALVISLLVAAWQVLQYVLSGARVRVRMSPGLLTEYRLTWAKKWSQMATYMAEEGGWPLEVAVIDVENRGRQAVTIYDPSLRLRSRGWLWRPARRRSASPRLLTEAGGGASETRVRLEPYDHARFVFDVWSVLAPAVSHRHELIRPLRVRGMVRVAGKRWRRVSSWRRGWRVGEGRLAFCEPVEIGLAAHRALWRHTWGNDDMRMHCIPVAIRIRTEFPADGPAPTKDDVQRLIEDEWIFPPGDKKPVTAALTAFYVAADLAHHYAGGPISS